MPDTPDLRYLPSFVAVAEELHFTRAAQRLHLTQQALSGQIRQLEASVGAPLFHRTTRKVELTDAGRTLLAHAIPLLAAASRAWQAAADADAGTAGTVSLSYAPTLRRHMLPILLDAFGRRYPNIEVRSGEVWWGDTPLINGLIEVTISRSHPTESPDIDSVVLFHSPLGLVLGRDHPLARDERASLDLLDGEALRLWPRAFSPHFHDTITSALRGGGFGGPVEEMAIFGSRLLGDDPASLADIASGRAFGIGFEGQYADLEPELVWREVTPTLPIPMFLSWRHDGSTAVRNFVTVAVEVADELYGDSETTRGTGPPVLVS
jgi:DNA-binding transcriptional LysR family regulator